MDEFKDKVVLVTGGTRGIGRACVEAFAAAGAKVALCGRSAETAQKAADEIGQGVEAHAANVGNPDDAGNLVKAVSESLGPIAILVNNAGITRDGLLMRMKNEDWQAVLDVNLSGAFYCSRAVSRGMLKQRWGRIINISSINGLRGQAGQANYSATKAGLIGFTKALARELGSRSVTVNVVAPGYIETDMTAGIGEELTAEIVKQTPLGRVGQSNEIASAVTFLASEGASYITGAVLQVDGGLAM